MPSKDFEERLAAIENSRTGPRPGFSGGGAPSPKRRGYNWRLLILGGLASLAVMILFANIQNISDLAPASVKEGNTPGAWGGYVAILTMAWIVIVPVWFVIGVGMSAFRGRGGLPGEFISGAFSILFVSFGIMQLAS